MKLLVLLISAAAIISSSTQASPPPDNLEEFIRSAEKHKADTGEDLDENELQRQFEQFQAQQQMMGGGERRFAREIPAIEPDVPYIQCQACELLVDQVSQRVATRRAKYPKTKLSEMQILEMLTDDGGICDPVQGTGQWLAEYDIKANGDGGLTVEHQVGQVGHCEEECKTLAMACENVLNLQDSEIAELAYLNKLDSKRVCYDQLGSLAGRCGGEKLPALPEDREDFEFKPKSEMDLALAEASRELRLQQQLNPDMFRDDL